MSAPIIVVGHKNPDNDSISSAVGYAYLKNELARRAAGEGEPFQTYVPARLGPLPPESAWVLEESGIPAPEIVGHVHARVGDVMTPNPISIGHNATLLEAGRLLRQHNVRALVVTNDDGTYRRLITTRMIAERYIAATDALEDGGANEMA
ncbi:MAG: CBS domain-containing protein, partial [Eggerthella sp.]|uniref:CBS domain-containing protein n=1 Tax=Eggerthella sp. TaxID=1929886 RepID=UPI00291186C2